MNFLHDWIQYFHLTQTAETVCILSLTIVLGLALGNISFYGVRLGMAGVMFSGILLGHFKFVIQPALGEFIREFGLMLFVYTIGVEVGPAFFSSIRKEGLRLNLLAMGIVVSGTLLTFLLAKLFHFSAAEAAGIFCGASTNTPGFAAAHQLLKEMPGVTPDLIEVSGLSYAITYPFGILGIILSMALVRVLLRVNPEKEADNHLALHLKENPRLEVMDLKIENSDLNKMKLREILAFEEVIISRVVHEGKAHVALPQTMIHLGDTIRAVGTQEQLNALCYAVGTQTQLEKHIENMIPVRNIVLTKTELAGRTIHELHAAEFGVTITRVRRGELEFPGTGEVKLAFGDSLHVVGQEEALRKFSAFLGNDPKTLNHPHLIPAFVCLVVGVFIGSIPFQIPGIPAPLKIGLAGGVLIAALLLSYVGRIGPLVWYLPTSGSLMLREIGIALFLACVGIQSGDHFVATFASGRGLLWAICGACVTVTPILLMGLFLRIKSKINYLTLCGLMAGSMTNPPSLAYANQLVSSSAPVMAYASVYPLVMILRVVSAELLLIFLTKG